MRLAVLLCAALVSGAAGTAAASLTSGTTRALGTPVDAAAVTLPPAAPVPGQLLTTPDAAGWKVTSGPATTSPHAPLAVVRASTAGPVTVQRGTVPVVAGSVYTGSFLERAVATTTTVSATLTWYDASGHQVAADTVTSAPVQDRTDSWTKVSVSGLTPATARTVTLAADLGDGTQHLLAQSALTRTHWGSRDLVGPLTTRGTTVRDAKGAVVVLRGVNRSGLNESGTPSGLTQRDLDRAKAWGANVVRLPLDEQLWLPGCPASDPGYQADVRKVVGWVTARHMLAVLDLHVGSPTCSSPGLNPMPDLGSRTFWRQVATAYKGNPLVAFDLFNEPHDVSDKTWRDGGVATTAGGVSYTAVGMQSLLDTVRATGAKNLVLVGGTGWASLLPSTAPLRGTNLVYAVHAYTCDRPSQCRSTDSHPVLDRFADLGRRAPVMVSEFGHPSSRTADGAAYMQDVLSYAEAHHWSWAAWDWHGHESCRWGDWWSLINTQTCSASGTYEPSPNGVPVLQALRRNAS